MTSDCISTYERTKAMGSGGIGKCARKLFLSRQDVFL